MNLIQSSGLSCPSAPAGRDHSRDALEVVHSLLSGPAEPANVVTLLAKLASAFGVRAAGVAYLSDGSAGMKSRYDSDHSPRPASERWPWEEEPALVQEAWGLTGTREINTSGGARLLIAGSERPGGACWLLWLEEGPERVWPGGEKAALLLAARVVDRLLEEPAEKARWQKAVEQQRLQRRLEEAATVTGRLAHDFGNVLTALVGFAELALPQLAPGSRPHQHVSEMYQAAQVGAQMIRKLSLFSRRRPSTQRHASLPGVLAGEMARVQKNWLPTVRLKLELPAVLPPVAVDADSLRQLLGQLLDNAREAIAAEGTVTVSARAVRLGADDCLEYLGCPVPGEHVEICLTDTGCGLSPDAARRLFNDLFFTTKPGLRGLGLAVVYGILWSHQGGVRFGPGPRGGTTVRLVLPQAGPSGAPRAPSEERPPGAACSALCASPLAAEKILVVDDDPMVLEMTGKILQRAGYRVQRAAGAAEALELYAASAQEPFQLVLSDLLMPSLSGFDLARKLQGLDPNVRILFVTGEIPARPQQGARTSGNVHMLGKPFRPTELVTTVREIFAEGNKES